MNWMKMALWMGLILCFFLILCVAVIHYIVYCLRWRKRIEEIRDGQTVYMGWNLKRLKETAKDLEYERVDQMELIF
ncbi:MAG: hypothetical protein NC543_15040 [bacterium]|nr:hypothetical protein [bacterium]MCM1373473.1 hypothetical protein [Muribaculum sp.]